VQTSFLQEDLGRARTPLAMEGDTTHIASIRRKGSDV
jgi:hypothetical protein